MRIRIPRPSPATVISLLALAVALGGTAYAASRIDGSAVRPGSLPGNRVERNSLTGKQINEGKLGPVPKLRNTFNTGLVSAKQGQTKELLKLGPFRVVGRCQATAAPIIMTTNRENSFGYSENDELDDANFDQGVELQLGYSSTASGNFAFYADNYNGWMAAAPRLTSIYRGEAGSGLDLTKNLNQHCSFIVFGRRIR